MVGFLVGTKPRVAEILKPILRAKAGCDGSQERGRVWFANPNPSLGLAKVKTLSNPSIFPCKINGIFMCMFVCAWLKIGTPFGGEIRTVMAAKGGGEKLESKVENQLPKP